MSCNILEIKKYYGIARRELPILFFRRFKTSYHKCRWADYENILMTRTMMNTLSRLILSLSFLVGGTESWHLTEQYFEKGGPPNIELAKKVFPYAKLANQIYIAGRIVLFLLCLKWPRLIKLTLYYENLL